MTHALLCPGPGLPGLAFILILMVTAPLMAGAVVGLVIGEVIKAVRRTRLR